MVTSDPWEHQLQALGAYIRAQRKLQDLSLRQLSDLAQVSNPYLSQVERGLHEPSVRVLRSIARALNLSAETLLAHAGIGDDDEASDADEADQREDEGGRAPRAGDTEAAIRRDPSLTQDQKQALLAVYRSYRAGNPAPSGTRASRDAAPRARRAAQPASRSTRGAPPRATRGAAGS
jgi:transcriptional regulator with XRE-family HTH domain